MAWKEAESDGGLNGSPSSADCSGIVQGDMTSTGQFHIEVRFARVIIAQRLQQALRHFLERNTQAQDGFLAVSFGQGQVQAAVMQ
jgi:hypothetical protein